MSKKAEEQYNAVAEALANDGAVKSAMFGMPSLKINGKAFAGLWNDTMVFKLTGDAHAEALSVRGAKLFDPMDGRPMKEWVTVPVSSANTWKEFAAAALNYVAKSAGKTKQTTKSKAASKPKK
jgi:hypothetical protein